MLSGKVCNWTLSVVLSGQKSELTLHRAIEYRLGPALGQIEVGQAPSFFLSLFLLQETVLFPSRLSLQSAISNHESIGDVSRSQHRKHDANLAGTSTAVPCGRILFSGVSGYGRRWLYWIAYRARTSHCRLRSRRPGAAQINPFSC